MFFAAMLHPCNTAGLIIWLKTNDDKWITFLFHTFFFLFQNWESTLAKVQVNHSVTSLEAVYQITDSHSRDRDHQGAPQNTTGGLVTSFNMCNTTFHYYHYHIQYNIYYQMQYYFYFLFYYLQYHCQFYFQFHCQYSCA